MLNKQDIIKILSSRFEKDLHKKLSEIPKPEMFKDIYKAANRIKNAIDNKQKIAIIGDYDVDGVVSTTILSEFFNDIGLYDFKVKIPNRFKDGYGLNPNLVQEFKDCDLIITVDNGIGAIEAALECKKYNIDLIITDHHIPPPNLPDAYAIINPKQEDCDFPDIEICGAQVAWYLVAALKGILKIKYDLCKFLDLLCIAVVADMMELRDMNRIFVRQGLNKINELNRPAFRAILQSFSKEKFECDDINFLLAPLINSSGRVDDAMNSFYFLRSKDLEEAKKYLSQICEFNELRKEQERLLFEQCLEQVNVENDEVVVVWGEDWHEGVLGIVASKLVRHYQKPAIVFSLKGQKAKGSARSIGKFNMLDAIGKCQNLLSSYGGHRAAAGLVCDKKNLFEFKKEINRSCVLMDIDKFSDSEGYLGEIDLKEVDLELLDILQCFEPYGNKNPKPFFGVNGAIVIDCQFIGRDKKHLKLNLQKDNNNFEALFFNFNFLPKINDRLDIVFSLGKNLYKGILSIQFVIKNINLLN